MDLGGGEEGPGEKIDCSFWFKQTFIYIHEKMDNPKHCMSIKQGLAYSECSQDLAYSKCSQA